MKEQSMARRAGAFLVVAFSGCGGGGEDKGPDPLPPSQPQIVNGTTQSSATTKWVSSPCLTGAVQVWFGSDGSCAQRTTFSGCSFSTCTWSSSGLTVTMGNLAGPSCIASIANVNGSTNIGSFSGAVTRADGFSPPLNGCSFVLTPCSGLC